MIPDFKRIGAAPERRPRVGALLRQRRLRRSSTHHAEILRADRRSPRRRTARRCTRCKFLEDRYQALIAQVLRDRQVAAAVHGAVVVVLRRRVLEPLSLLDLGREGRQPARQRLRPAARCGTSQRRRELREDVVDERCSHCWTPCEAYPTILGNLARAAVSRGPAELQPIPAETP